MKKIILSLTFLLVGMIGFSGIYVTQQGADKNTGNYDKVTEKHEGYIWKDHHLTCSNPGNKPCNFVVDPATPAGSGNEMLNEVIGLIQSGQFSGTLNFGSGVIATWSGESESNYSISIEW